MPTKHQITPQQAKSRKRRRAAKSKPSDRDSTESPDQLNIISPAGVQRRGIHRSQSSLSPTHAKGSAATPPIADDHDEVVDMEEFVRPLKFPLQREIKGILPAAKRAADSAPATRRLRSVLPEYGVEVTPFYGDANTDREEAACFFNLQVVAHETRESPYYGPWHSYLDYAFRRALPPADGWFTTMPQYPLVRDIDTNAGAGNVTHHLESSHTEIALDEGNLAGNNSDQEGEPDEELSEDGGSDQEEEPDEERSAENDSDRDEGLDEEDRAENGSNQERELNEKHLAESDDEQGETDRSLSTVPATEGDDRTQRYSRSTRIPDFTELYTTHQVVATSAQPVWSIGRIVLIAEIKPPMKDSDTAINVPRYISSVDSQTIEQAQHAFHDERRKPKILGIITACGSLWSYREIRAEDLPKPWIPAKEWGDSSFFLSDAGEMDKVDPCGSLQPKSTEQGNDQPAEPGHAKALGLKVAEFLKDLCEQPEGYFVLGTRNSTLALVRIAQRLRKVNVDSTVDLQ